MNFIEVFKLILSLFPLIINAVKTIEVVLPQSGKGAEKLALLQEMLSKSYEVSNQAYGTFEQVWPTIKGTIEGVVKLFNSVGIFKKSE